MEEITEYLIQTNQYDQLIQVWNDREDLDIFFEVLFAHWCHKKELILNYEVNINPNNDKSVDFNFISESQTNINFELVRPDISQGIRDKLSGNVLQGYLLTSEHQNPDFRTCAQLIRLQWALLEKVKKFPTVDDNNVNVIVVDCSNIHHGMFDHHDLGMTMYGYPGNPIWQEFWEGNKLIGIWEDGYDQRNSDLFNKNISGVIFVPKQTTKLLEGAMLAINPLLSNELKQQLLDELKVYEAFIKINAVQ